MPRPLKVLLVEDSADDTELLLQELVQAGFAPEWRRVDCEADFIANLSVDLDLIISDLAMPRFDGMRALESLHATGLEIPFIIVSGKCGEDTAVAAMKQGAADYLLKDRLARLGQAVEQVLERSRRQRERRLAEQVARENALSLNLAQEIGRFGSWELDLTSLADVNRNPLRWSEHCYRVFGFEPGEVEVTNELFFSLVHPDDRTAVSTAVQGAIAQRGRYLVEHRIVLRNGELKHVREAGRIFTDPDSGQPTKLVGTVHDITEERRADAALRAAHAQLNHFVARSPTVIYSLRVARGQARLHFVSENLPTMLGWTAEEALHPAWLREQLHPEDIPALEASLHGAIEHGTSRVEYRIRNKSGSYLWLEDRRRLLNAADAGPQEIVGGWTDITARKEAEASARETEERFRQLVENIHEVFWMIDVQTRQMLYISPGYQRIWGRTCESLYQSSQSWFDSIHEVDRPRVMNASIAKQGTGEYDEIYRVVRPDGAVRWVHDRAFPIKEGLGQVRRVVGVAEDITARKELEEQFRRAQRLEAIGTLSSGIAHDLNNILTPMLVIAPLLREKVTDPQDLAMLGIVEHGAQRGADIIKQLLTFSRGVEGERGIVHPQHVLKEMIAIMRETFPREIEVIDRAPPDLWPVIADATQLHQVFMNLCVNARDAMPSGGRLTLKARNVILTEAEASAHPPAKPGPHMAIAVADTGHGIPPELLDRIFEPFFTTKEVGKGTGLGLSTVLGIVKSHGGFVKVSSEAGHGSEFEVFLSAARDLAEVRPAAPVPTQPVGRGELILLVDDEESIRIVVQRVLEQQHYRVVTAANGKAALAVFLEQRERVRLLLTDLMMPAMGGIAIVRAFRALEPRLEVVAMTGLNDQVRREELAALGVTEILMKPCGPSEIIDAVQRRLAARDAADSAS